MTLRTTWTWNRARVTRTLTFVLSFLAFAGCMDRTDDELLNPLLPSITLRWPRSGEVVMTGRREIQYDIESLRSATVYELVVNDSLLGSFPAGPDGSKPALLWQVDTMLISSGARYYLRAYDMDGNSTKSGVMTNIRVVRPALPPAAPKNLALWRISGSAVNLTWEDVASDESSYELWRSTGTGPLVRIQTLSANSVSTNDTALAAGLLYRYRVRAVNVFGFGESNEVSTGGGNPVLYAPTNLAGTARGTRQVELQWSDNSSGELGFVIQRRVNSGTVYSQIGLVGPDETTYLDTAGLVSGTAYTYRVAARGQFGSSGWSNEETVTTLYQDVYPPTGLTGVYEAISRSVRLTWKDNTIFESQTRIERRTNPFGTFVEIGRTGVDVTSYGDSAVTGGLIYSYRVRAFTASGYFTPYSNEFTVTVPGTPGISDLLRPGIPESPSPGPGTARLQKQGRSASSPNR